jgi:hypothetical protein
MNPCDNYESSSDVDSDTEGDGTSMRDGTSTCGSNCSSKHSAAFDGSTLEQTEKPNAKLRESHLERGPDHAPLFKDVGKDYQHWLLGSEMEYIVYDCDKSAQADLRVASRSQHPDFNGTTPCTDSDFPVIESHRDNDRCV